MYWEGRIDRYATNQQAWSLTLSINSASVYSSLDFNSDTILRIRRRNGNNEQISSISYRTMKDDYLKICVVFYNSLSHAIFINGFFIQSFTLGTEILYNYDHLRIGCGLNNSLDSGQRQGFKSHVSTIYSQI